MSKIIVASLVVVALAVVGLVGAAWADGLSGDPINWYVLGSSGGPASAEQVSINATLGQTAIGWSDSSDYNTGSGYWTGETAAGSQLVYLPLLSKNYQGLPDLVIERLTAGSRGAIVVIKNRSTVASTDDFWVDVYYDPDQLPGLNQPWDTIADHGLVWGVKVDLGPGERLILTTNDQYFRPKLSSAAPLPLGVEVYAFVDSVDFATDYGAVLESNEGNNLGGPVLSRQHVDCCQAAGEQLQPPVQGGLPAR